MTGEVDYIHALNVVPEIAAQKHGWSRKSKACGGFHGNETCPKVNRCLQMLSWHQATRTWMHQQRVCKRPGLVLITEAEQIHQPISVQTPLRFFRSPILLAFQSLQNTNETGQRQVCRHEVAAPFQSIGLSFSIELSNLVYLKLYSNKC